LHEREVRAGGASLESLTFGAWSVGLDHGLVVPGAQGAVCTGIWDIASRREPWPFLALYTNRRAEAHKGLWFEDDIWSSSYAPSGGPALNVVPLPSHPEYTEEYGRYQPEDEEQFLKTCRSTTDLALVVPPAWTDEQTLTFLRSAHSLRGVLQERFFDRRGKERGRSFREVLRPVSPRGGWAFMLFCFDDIPVSSFLSDDPADIEALFQAVGADKHRFEKW